MNRRGFFKRTIGALASAYLAPLLPAAAVAPPAAFVGPIMFKGVPIVFDQYAASSRIYFLSRSGPYCIDALGTHKISRELAN